MIINSRRARRAFRKAIRAAVIAVLLVAAVVIGNVWTAILFPGL